MKYLVVRIGVLTIIAFGAVSLFGQATAAAPCFNRIGQKEWAILLSDLDPEKRKSLQDDAMRKAQVENMRELLAFACHATKLGVNSEQMNFNELEFIRSETIAGEYDKKRTKVKPGEPFSWITDAQVTAFYKKPANTTAFKRFYETKLTMMRRSAPPGTRVPLTNVDEAPAQDYYARMKIAEAAAATLLTPAERSKAEMKVKMQQVQFLARLAAEEIGPELTVSDAEVAAYIAQHPEFDSKTALDKATKIRDRARAGEDFAALANEFTEDPGNDGDNGKKNGGLYANVAKGVMVPQFEKATLALEPGQVSDVVQSDYGYHVIKLERKSVDGSRYDVRHILIGTGYKDPDDPNGRAIPATLYVRTKLEVDLEAKVINRILAENPVTVEDIKLPVTPPSRPATTRPATATRPATRKR